MLKPARTAFFLEVIGGDDHGARLAITQSVRAIGRARDADLVLRDLGISRRHLHVVATENGVQFNVCGDAAAFLVGGRPLRAIEARVGERILVGNTLLVVASAEAVTASERPSVRGQADVRTLLTGVGAEARAMAAIHTLIESLDAAQDDGSASAALSQWAAEQTPSCTVEMRRGVESRRGVVEGDEQGKTVLTVPAPATDPASLAFTCAAPAESITDSFRRMLVVAGRLFGSTLTRLHQSEVAYGEVAALRALSFGTARDFIGASPAAQQLASRIPRLALSDASVLLEGETGVGKTFVARLIHEASPRAREPLRVINCAAIPESLVESELFGHERGAFTGASAHRVGALEAAGAGTLFLDEVAELSLASQAKLLRALEERQFERLGSNRTIELRARLLTATNRDLDAMAKAGAFRHDLLYRIAVVKIRIPPLRERGDDLRTLALRMLADLVPSAGRRVDGFSKGALDAIDRYRWPGNVRELRNAIERALVIGEGPEIEAADLPEIVLGTPPMQPEDESLVRLPADLRWLEGRAIEAALKVTDGNQRRAALLLGINRVTLNRKLRDAKESRPEGEGD